YRACSGPRWFRRCGRGSAYRPSRRTFTGPDTGRLSIAVTPAGPASGRSACTRHTASTSPVGAFEARSVTGSVPAEGDATVGAAGDIPRFSQRAGFEHRGNAFAGRSEGRA